MTILAVTFAIHCTDLLDRWAGPGTLDWVMVTPAVQAVVACCCLVLFMNSIYVLGQFTCCCKFCMVAPPPSSTPTLHTNPSRPPNDVGWWSQNVPAHSLSPSCLSRLSPLHSHTTATGRKTKRSWELGRRSPWKVRRICQWYHTWFTGGTAPYFAPWTFAREVMEFVLQTIVLAEMADEGTDPTLLKAYAVVIFVNSLSSLVLTRHFTSVLTKQRLLFFDALCDLVYGTTPLARLIGVISVGGTGVSKVGSATYAVQQQVQHNASYMYSDANASSATAFGADGFLRRNMLLSVAETAMQGGYTFGDVFFKISTRLLPFMFATRRLKTTLMIRRRRRALLADSTAHLPRLRRFNAKPRPRSVDIRKPSPSWIYTSTKLRSTSRSRSSSASPHHHDACGDKEVNNGNTVSHSVTGITTNSFFSRGPRDKKAVALPIAFPLCLAAAACALLATVFVAMEQMQCPATPLWQAQCLSQSYPLFDSTYVVPAFVSRVTAPCPCHTLVGGAGDVFPQGCGASATMDQITSQLFNVSAASQYTRAVILRNCATTCAHLDTMFRGMAKLRVLAVTGGPCRSVPYTVGQLASLRSMMFQRMTLRSLPSSAGRISTLREVQLGENEFTEVVPAAVNWHSLALLNLTHNAITAVPERWLLQLPANARVLLFGNPFCNEYIQNATLRRIYGAAAATKLKCTP